MPKKRGAWTVCGLIGVWQKRGCGLFEGGGG